MFVVYGWLESSIPKFQVNIAKVGKNLSQHHLNTRFTMIPHTPILQSQFFSQSYESILPNSFTHILLCTRGCSPWKPEAVLSTPTRWKNLWGIDPAIFKERNERTELHSKKWSNFAVNMTSSLRKGIPTSQVRTVKKKRGLFSIPIPPCRSLVALPRNLPQLTSFWNLNQIPFRGTMIL